MSRALRRCLLAVFLAVPLAAAAQASVRVVEPAGGAILTGGSTAVIRWSGSAEAADVEEWEAFLSVDGGRYYAVRITPHLDVSVREFHWIVPNVASKNVRILIRFGNEKDEHATELPLALTIEPARAGSVASEQVSTPGEPARPGDPGVVQWAEGNRSGAGVVQMTTAIPSLAVLIAPGIQERSAIEQAASAPRVACTGMSARTQEQASRFPPVVQLIPEVLLRCCRLNI